MKHQAALICAALKQNRKKEKREKIREKEVEEVDGKGGRRRKWNWRTNHHQGNLSLILGFVMNWLCKIYMVDVYILFKGVNWCGWIIHEWLLGFWTCFVEIDDDYGVLVVEKNVYQGFDMFWWRNGLDRLLFDIKGWLDGY